MISKMTSFAELVKNGVLMIIHIYAKVMMPLSNITLKTMADPQNPLG
jgi:hypothetical protein